MNELQIFNNYCINPFSVRNIPNINIYWAVFAKRA